MSSIRCYFIFILKVRPSSIKKVGFICINESPLKKMSYFPYKSSFYKIFKFSSWLFRLCQKTTWYKTTKVNFKICDDTSWKQIITVHMLSNISRSKCNQTMKFGRLIECDVSNIFLGKPCRKWVRENSSRTLFCFLKKALYEEKSNRQHLIFNIFW